MSHNICFNVYNIATNNDDNLVASCMECNLGKGSNMLLNEPEIDTEGLNEYMDNLSKTIGRS